MKKTIIVVFALAGLVGGFAVLGHVQKTHNVAELIQPLSDPGAGGGRTTG